MCIRDSINVVLDRSEHTLFSISEQRTTRDLQPVRDIASTYLERMELLRERGDEFIGVPTGFSDLDKMLSGLNKSDLVIVAARPGMGKTALEISIALNAARRYDKRVAIFNLEMSGEQLLQRMIAAETRIDSQLLRRGELADHEWAIFLEALGRLSETRIYIDDTPSISPMQLRTKCRRLYAEHGLDLVMIDYLQLMPVSYTHLHVVAGVLLGRLLAGVNLHPGDFAPSAVSFLDSRVPYDHGGGRDVDADAVALDEGDDGVIRHLQPAVGVGDLFARGHLDVLESHHSLLVYRALGQSPPLAPPAERGIRLLRPPGEGWREGLPPAQTRSNVVR